jgi:hypothetical protein
VWQQLCAELKDTNFTVLAIAEESRGAETARPWIEAAKPEYPCLIDVEHVVAARYGMVNVPQAVWIDADGRIVRGPETAGSTDHFRRMDLATRTMAPEDMTARLAARVAYMDAVKDWARTGRHALDGDAARAGLPEITAEIARADVHFRLGLYLREQGRDGEAVAQFAEAARLHPDSWNMWRQAADLEAIGNSGGPAFWARVKALGERPYYPPPDLPGFPAGAA